MKSDKIINGQINFNNETNVNSKEITKSINFFKLLPFNNIETNQYSLFKKMSIVDLFKDKTFISPYNTKNCIFEKISIDDRYIFFKYGNKTGIDPTLQIIYKDGKKVSPIDLILENFTFILLDYKDLKIAVIKNKSTSKWDEDFISLCKNYNMKYRLIPFKNNQLLNHLKSKKLKAIEFTTASKDKIGEYCDFNEIDNKLISPGLVFSQITQKFTIKEYQPTKAQQFIENKFIRDKEQYSNIKLDFGDKICDLIKETITLNVKIPIPENIDTNNTNLNRLKEIMMINLQQYT